MQDDSAWKSRSSQELCAYGGEVLQHVVSGAWGVDQIVFKNYRHLNDAKLIKAKHLDIRY